MVFQYLDKEVFRHQLLNYLLPVPPDQENYVQHLRSKKYLSGIKPKQVATSYALAEELAVVVVVIQANIACYAVVHERFHIHIAFIAEVSQSQHMPLSSHLMRPPFLNVFVPLPFRVIAFCNKSNFVVLSLRSLLIFVFFGLFELFVDIVSVYRFSDARVTKDTFQHTNNVQDDQDV